MPKFFRRLDLTCEIRTNIGLDAINAKGQYGAIIDLARKNNISRKTVYKFKNSLLDVFSLEKKESETSDKDNYNLMLKKSILGLRFCCKSSITGISEYLRCLGNGSNTSIGHISKFLNEISINAVDDLPIRTEKIDILADEIFISGQPILVIMDATDHYILAIELAKDRTGETWESCYQGLIDKGYNVNIIAKDLGSGLQKGVDLINENNDINFISRPDLFHLLCRFNPPLAFFSRKAYGAIELEESSINCLENRKSDEAKLKWTEKAVEIIDDCEVKIFEYDAYFELYYALHDAFNPFSKDGILRNEKTIMNDIDSILNLFEWFFPSYNKIQDAVSFLRKHISGYFSYINDIEYIINKYNKILPFYQINLVCKTYQTNLKSIAVKDYQHSKKLKNEADDAWKLASIISQMNESEAIDNLLKELNKTVRSSSALEAKNSVLRKFFNTSSNQITQENLNLIVFYMNHKTSIRGKYKGKSPFERFTGIIEDESFIEKLLA